MLRRGGVPPPLSRPREDELAARTCYLHQVRVQPFALLLREPPPVQLNLPDARVHALHCVLQHAAARAVGVADESDRVAIVCDERRQAAGRAALGLPRCRVGRPRLLRRPPSSGIACMSVRNKSSSCQFLYGQLGCAGGAQSNRIIYFRFY